MCNSILRFGTFLGGIGVFIYGILTIPQPVQFSATSTSEISQQQQQYNSQVIHSLGFILTFVGAGITLLGLVCIRRCVREEPIKPAPPPPPPPQIPYTIL